MWSDLASGFSCLCLWAGWAPDLGCCTRLKLSGSESEGSSLGSGCQLATPLLDTCETRGHLSEELQCLPSPVAGNFSESSVVLKKTSGYSLHLRETFKHTEASHPCVPKAPFISSCCFIPCSDVRANSCMFHRRIFFVVVFDTVSM